MRSDTKYFVMTERNEILGEFRDLENAVVYMTEIAKVLRVLEPKEGLRLYGNAFVFEYQNKSPELENRTKVEEKIYWSKGRQ